MSRRNALSIPAWSAALLLALAAQAVVPASAGALHTAGVITHTNVSQGSKPPACTYGDQPTYLPDGSATYAVLDTDLRLPRGWKPPALESIGHGASLQPAAAKAWRDLHRGAKRAGIALYAVSAYRSEAYQSTVFNRNVRQHGRAHALKYVARPGHSEHQLGLTVDIGYARGTAITSEVLVKPHTRNQKAAAWLAARGWRYGWVRSYPKGKVAGTCYESEPWHWRYVGPAKAAIIRQQRELLRTFLWGYRPH